jgi:hypothetical protein
VTVTTQKLWIRHTQKALLIFLSAYFSQVADTYLIDLAVNHVLLTD